MSKKSKLGFFARPAQFLLYALSGWFPRNPQLWVFGSWGGNRLPGNAAAVFRFAGDQPETSVPPVWVSFDKGVREILRREGRIALHPWSPKGMMICLRAGVFVYDVCGNDVNYWLSRGARNVLLRHGTGIKKVGRAIENPAHHLHQLYHGSLLQRCVYGFLLPWHHTSYDLVIASSEQHAAQATAFFYVDEENVAITGSPRADVLFDGPAEDAQDPALDWIRAGRENGQKICLYMPTFRDDKSPAFPYPWHKFDAICARRGVRMLVRLHPIDRSEATTDDMARLEHLRLHETGQDPTLLFRDIDCLMTDYSSVVYDFMLLEKPVIFFCHDLARFLETSRELYFDLEDVTPGPMPKDLDALEAALSDLSSGRLANQPSGMRYQATLNLFHQFQDGHASKRVWKEIRRRFLTPASIDAD